MTRQVFHKGKRCPGYNLYSMIFTQTNIHYRQGSVCEVFNLRSIHLVKYIHACLTRKFHLVLRNCERNLILQFIYAYLHTPLSSLILATLLIHIICLNLNCLSLMHLVFYCKHKWAERTRAYIFLLVVVVFPGSHIISH